MNWNLVAKSGLVAVSLGTVFALVVLGKITGVQYLGLVVAILGGVFHFSGLPKPPGA